MYEVRRYTTEYTDEWNQFVSASKNGTFLFDRRFMDYHADRFHDHSLLVYRDRRLYALLPANEKGVSVPNEQVARDWFRWIVRNTDFDQMLFEHSARLRNRWLHLSCRWDRKRNRHQAIFNYRVP